MDNVNYLQTFALPSAYDQQMLEAKRRQQLADMLQQQASQSIVPQQGRIASKINPLAGVAQMLASGLGGYERRQAENAQLAANQADVQNAMSFMDKLQAGKKPDFTPDQALAASLSSEPTSAPQGVPFSPQEQQQMLIRQSMTGGPRSQAIAQMLMKSTEQQSPYGKINPADWTSDSLKKFNATRTMANPTGDVSILEPRVSVNTQATIEAENKRWAGLSGNQLAQLGFDAYKFNNLSADQKANISTAIANKDIAAARLLYDTGISAGGGRTNIGMPPAGTNPIQNQTSYNQQSVNPPIQQSAIPLINSNIPQKDRNALLISKPDETQKLSGVTGSIDRMLLSIQSLKDEPGLNSILGTVASRTPNLSENAGNAQASFNRLLNQSAVAALNEMRAASKTGGAVGNVTEKEWPILQSQLANLDQTQSPESFRKNLDSLEQYLNNLKTKAVSGYEMTYGTVPTFQQQTTNVKIPAGAVRLKK